MISWLMPPRKRAGDGWVGETGWMEHGRRTKAGTTISESASMNISVVYRAVDLISNAFKSCPLFVIRKNEDGDKERITDHPAYRLLHDAPCEYMSPSRFKKFFGVMRLLWGNAIAEIERTRGGTPVALHIIHSSRIIKVQVGLDGHKTWFIRNDDGTQTTLNDDDVLHHANISLDGYLGKSMIRCAMESLGLTVAAESYGAKYFGNSAVPSGVLTTPNTMKPEALANLRESWKARLGGDGQQGTAVLENGVDFKGIGVPNEQAQFIELRKLQVIEFARFSGCPPHKLMDLERATFTNIEHQAIEFTTDCIRPIAIDFEEECDRKLLTQADRDAGISIEMSLDALLRGDLKARYDAYQIGRQGGWLSANDVLRREGENPIDADGGDDYWRPVNMVPSDTPVAMPTTQGAAGAATEAAPNEKDTANASEPTKPTLRATIDAISAAHRPVIVDALARMATQEINGAKRAAKQAGGIAAWAGPFYAEHLLRVRGALIPAADAYAGLIAAVAGREVDLEGVGVVTADIAKLHCDGSRDALLAGAALGAELHDPVANRLMMLIEACLKEV